MAESISDVRQKLMRAKSTISNFREETREVSERGTEAVLGVAGAAIAGVLRNWDDAGPVEIPGTDVPVDLVVGGAAVLAGVTGLAGKNASRQTMVFGIGMAAPGIAQHAGQMVREYRSK